MKKRHETNKIFLAIIIASLIIGGSIYFGFRESAKISRGFQNDESKSQLASLQGQVIPLIETPASTTPVLEEPALEPEPEEEVDPCESLNCDDQDGWVKSGSVYSCQDGSKTCSCQKKNYRNYSCSASKKECTYSTTDTKVEKYSCVEPEPEPDLIIQSPVSSPASPVEEDDVTFWATVKNQGNKSATSSLCYVSIDGQKFTEFSTAGLTADESIVATGSAVWSATAGEHKIEFCADGAKTVKESNEINNCTSITFTVMGKIPDLIIQSLDIVPTSLFAGQLVSFGGTVKNQGGAPAAPTLTILRLDLGNNGSWDVEAGAVSTPILAINGSETAMWRDAWTSVSGIHKFEVCADAVSEPELRIAESNENNNCLSRIVVIP